MSNSLRRILAQDDTVIFVGSGISRWSGLPSWEGLIDELAKFLEKEDIDATLMRREANGDLLQAASYGFLKLTPPQITQFIRQACRTSTAIPAEIHEAIMKLGPSCFITTNYDDLLEQAHRSYKKVPDLRVVINNQLIEQAEIIHAQARNFIFKPHGDVNATDSIVLTREQYRKLLPGGPLNATLNTLQTLLQSRPVLFIGFGLRDPDFLYLRDILANIYRGGMRDHYAIVADPVSDQTDYWRSHYGIHLVGYQTGDSGRDHTALVSLLHSLKAEDSGTSADPINLDSTDPATVLAIARYAASCLVPSPGDRFRIRVSSEDHNQMASLSKKTYHYWPVERLLQDGPSQLILIGEPGSGKSFAIREAVNSIASSLQDACLCGKLIKTMRIPVVIDLKQYDGHLIEQVGSKFPEGLTFHQLYSAFPINLYLDGYNELPRDFRESGSLDQQLLELLECFPDVNLVIGSRTSDGLERLEIPVFSLSIIDDDEVESWLEKEGVSLPKAHAQISSVFYKGHSTIDY